MIVHICQCNSAGSSTHVSANTMRVFVTFSMVNLVFPPFPAILPMALDKWSPFRGFTARERREKRIKTHTKEENLTAKRNNQGDAILPSVTSKLSRKSSSNLMRARASWEEKTCVLCYKTTTKFK